MARARKSSTGGQRLRQVLVGAGIVAALVFAVEGGEYGTRDLLNQRARRVKLVRTIDSLTRIVDSLERYKRRVENDPALQERIVREEFGMVRGPKELLYRFSDPDSGRSP